MSLPSRRVLVPVIVAVLVLAAFLTWRTLGRRDDKPLTLYGNVDIREVNLSFRVDGRVADLMVDEGDQVRAGQLIARLDPDPLRTELEESEANVSAQQSQLSLLRAGNRAEDIAQAQATVEERLAALRDAQADVSRLAQLRGSGATSVRAYENATSARDGSVAKIGGSHR